MLDKPLVSIVIPLYNRVDLIGDTISSIINQTYINWEAVVVDDGSNDGSFERVEELAKSDGRIRILKRDKESKGASVCRNIGVTTSRGQYLIFLDSDDILSSDCIEGRIKKTKEYPDCDFWVFSTVSFTHNISDADYFLNLPVDGDPIFRFINMDVPWLTTGPIWKKETLDTLGHWDENALSWQDWEYHFRAVLLGLNYVHFSIVDNYLRRNCNVQTIGDQSMSLEHLQSHLSVIKRLINISNKKGVLSSHFNKILFWITEIALQKGYANIATDSIGMATGGYRTKIKCKINQVCVRFFGLLVFSFPVSDFGIMRRIKYKI